MSLDESIDQRHVGRRWGGRQDRHQNKGDAHLRQPSSPRLIPKASCPSTSRRDGLSRVEEVLNAHLIRRETRASSISCSEKVADEAINKEPVTTNKGKALPPL
ncbi:uncharacterized protein BT62DRAFT_1011983 [Guyanagaster necrorhizus]|uniref:Uncharacterized protein n=1 Tax=Guyanagaster necrorhizus TaxID=856835 RepID=A0A9P8ANT1_9AGAR|nr:uncharacterized protein BT62DRAFT_1011983 [Guyanagaster necrorhizus MCA 3950]KAG7441172.1 hypothetical protein BT62DRAFT_1011983 [Guyanagaster necrorhizus MCA 3950]